MRIQLTFRKLLVPLCAVALSIITFSNVNAELTQADLVPGSSDGLLIRDSSSQLEWLRLTETQGLSVVDVIDDDVGGYADLGFELANVEQVENLFLAAGIVELSTGFIEENYAPATFLMELFGCLQGCDGDLPAMHGWVQAPDLPDWVLHGVVQTASCCPPSGRAYVLDISGAPKTTRSEVHGVFLVRPTLAMDVWIDIVPRKTSNRINLQSDGTVKVSVLTEGPLDALKVDPKTARFGPSEAVPASHRHKDIDRDGDKDLLLSFWIQKTGIACTDLEATLTGALYDGTLITGTDYVHPVHCQ